MGGDGSGGRRPGAGRKPKTAREREIDGNAGHRGKLLSHPSATTAPDPVEVFDAPDDFTREERAVWGRLAPHAFANRTLTTATALAFEMLCRNVVLERRLSQSALGCAGSDHRWLIQRVDAELASFNLKPCGKALYTSTQPQAAANPLNKFLERAK